MGKADPKVEVSNGNKARVFSFPTVFPERFHEPDLRRSDLKLVRVISKNGINGMAERVKNRRHVKDSAAHFGGDMIADVNTIVQDLGELGACVAFVKLPPTVPVSIPVFVVNDDELKELKELRGKDTRVTLLRNDSNHIDLRKKKEANVSKPIEHARAASNQAEPEIKATVLRNDSNHIDLPKMKEANKGKMSTAHAKAVSNQAEPETIATVLRNESNHVDLSKKKEANNEKKLSYAEAVSNQKNSETIVTALRNDSNQNDLPSKKGANPSAILMKKEEASFIGMISKPIVTGFFKTVKRAILYEPKVRTRMERILSKGCDWFPRGGDLSLFSAAMDLLVEAENSDKVEKELAEIQHQLENHMIQCEHNVDVVLIAYCACLLRSMKLRMPTKGHRACIEKCLNNLTFDLGSPSLFKVTWQSKGESSLNPHEPLLEATNTLIQKVSRSKLDEDFLVKLLWVKVHHCGESESWEKLVVMFDSASFRPFSPSVRLLCSIYDPESIYSLGFFIQTSIEANCDFVDYVREEKGDSSSRDRVLINVDPSGSSFKNVFQSWLGRIRSSNQMNDELCKKFLTCLGLVSFVKDSEDWTRQIFQTLVQSFCRKDLLKLDVLLVCNDVEYLYYSTFRDAIIQKIKDELEKCQEYFYFYERGGLDISVLKNLLNSNRLGNLLGQVALFESVQKYIFHQMEKSMMEIDLSIVSVLGVLYERMVGAGEVQYEKIRTFVLTSLDKAMVCSYWQKSNVFLENIFYTARSKRELFHLPQLSLVHDVAQLVITHITAEMNYCIDPECLRNLSLDHSGDGTLIACLTKELKSLMCSQLDLEGAICVHRGTISKGELDLDLLLDGVLLNAIERWCPKDIKDVIQINGLDYLNHFSGEKGDLIKSKFESLEHLFCKWTKSSKRTDGLCLMDIQEVFNIYDRSKWDALQILIGKSLLSATDLGFLHWQLAAILGTIKAYVYSQTPQPLLGIFRRYECNVDSKDGIARVLNDCMEAIDLSKRTHVMKNHSIATIRALSLEVAHFHKCFQSQIEIANYFLAANCQLFSACISFGSWGNIAVEEFVEKITTARNDLTQLLDCESDDLLRKTKGATEMFIYQSGLGVVDHDALKQDLSLLLACPRLHFNDHGRFLLLVSLINIKIPLKGFVDCCEQLHFRFVSEDASFAQLVETLQELESDEDEQADFEHYRSLGENIVDATSTPDYANEMQNEFLADALFELALFLTAFKAVANTADVWIFVREMQWFGKEGLKQFYTEHSNVTNKLLFAAYESSVLDSLEPAVRFLSHLGSLHTEVDMKRVILDLKTTFKHNRYAQEQRLDALYQVQQNIIVIRDWFDTGFDDMAAIFSKFDSVWKRGKFIIRANELCLQWNNGSTSEKISGPVLDEFAQQLGFVQHENEDISFQISSFLEQLQIFRKVTSIQCSVLSEGYPYKFEEFEHFIKQDIQECRQKLQESRNLLKKSESWGCELRSKYPLAALFTKHDLRNLYTAIFSDGKDLSIIIPMLLFVIPSRQLPELYDEVLSSAKKCLDKCDLAYLHTHESWVQTISEFLVAFHNEIGSRQSHTKNSCRGIFLHSLNCNGENGELLNLLVISHIYKERLPECFELLDGFCNSSAMELNSFLDRVAAFPNQIFTIINVQALPGRYQEIIVDFTSRQDAALKTCNLHCVQQSETMLHSSPWVEEITWDDKNFNAYTFDAWGACILDTVNIRTVRVVVSSSSGAGKTRFIKDRIESCSQKDPGLNIVSIGIHEGTSLESLAQSLRKHQSCKPSKNLVYFSLHVPLTKSDPKLIKSLNHFFNHLLLSRCVRIPSSGEVFVLGWSEWDIFIEIPSVGFKTNLEDSTIKLLRRYLPILSVCATVQVPPNQFSIQKEAHRVCIYLRAFSDGTINRKFEKCAGKRLVFVIDDSGSMGVTLDDGRSPFDIAMANALNLFDTLVNIGDMFGLIIYHCSSRTQVKFQTVRDDAHKEDIRRHILRTTFEGGQTQMYQALNLAMTNLRRTDDHMDSWIVCLTDGESDDDEYETLRQNLLSSSPKLNIMVVGVNLHIDYENHLRDLCSKFGCTDRGAFIPSTANADSMNNAFCQVANSIPVSETFELDGTLTDDDCWRLMKTFLPKFVESSDMQRIVFWIEFLYKRVKTLDMNEEFNYNEKYDALGSSLMEVMLEEATKLLAENHNTNWTDCNHEQLIYDFTDPSKPQFRLICTAPDKMLKETRDRYEALDLPGFVIPTSFELRQRKTLDQFISHALNVPLDASERLRCIDENKFVLTLDFVMKLLNIHERVACHIPCVIEGETGVSKTALTKMYSILRNSECEERARGETAEALDKIVESLRRSSLLHCDDNVMDSYGIIRNAVLDAADETRTSETEIACKLHDLLLVHCEERSSLFEKIPRSVNADAAGDNVLEFLDWFQEAALEQTFFELNVDASLNETDVKKFFQKVSKTADKLISSGAIIIVFLDEVNTSSVIGLFKEIIIDHSICGAAIQENVVIVAACNPSGRKSLASKSSRECDLAREWASGHYQVNELPESISSVKWMYGSLDARQEKEFVLRRIEMLGRDIPNYLLAELTELIVSSQEAIRFFATDEIEKRLSRLTGESSEGPMSVRQEAENRARSTVSLRDIQRVFHLFHFFTTEFQLTTGDDHKKTRDAMYLSVGVVYYLKLDSGCRKKFKKMVSSAVPAANYIQIILDDVMTQIMMETKIPESIALTDGLKENVFMTLVCALSLTPLIIVGPPGTSKTMAVNIVDDNANGKESLSLLYRKCSRVTALHYQCSKSSTSSEISSVFEEAIRRQNCSDPSEHKYLVFMDEAGLAEEDKESLKVLHYYLEGHMSTKSEVGFVAITNHVLDAAKSNRCVSLLRQDPEEKEMLQIAEGVLYDRALRVHTVHFLDKKFKTDDFALKLCAGYKAILSLKDFETFFGLRDFIYFLKSLKQRSVYLDRQAIKVTLEDAVYAIERNFNGVEVKDFERLVVTFLQTFVSLEGKYAPRSPLHVLGEVLSTADTSISRYTLIIDESRDDSILRVLKNEGLLEISQKTLFKLSNLAENSHLEKLSLVSGVKFAASQGSKVILSQTDSINESFYDLFNLNFRRLKRKGNELLFANIAVGGISRRSLISSKFQCVLHVSAAELPHLPAPFLNRFEKFRVSPESILSSKLDHSSLLKRILFRASVQANKFASVLQLCSFVSKQTIESCILEMLSNASKNNSPFHDDNLNGAKSFQEYFILFANVHLKCYLSNKEFDSIIQVGLKHLKLSESDALLALLQKTEIMYAKEAFEECISNKPCSMVSILVERLSEMVVTRQLIFDLLELATPENIHAQRNVLPKDILTEYFRQEHFGLKPFLQNICSQTVLQSRRYIVHVRSDVGILQIPTLRAGERCPEKIRNVRNHVQDNAESLIIEHLNLLRNESSLRSAIESWSTNSSIQTLLLFADMSSQGAFDTVNFARCCIDQTPTSEDKLFVAILHYPPSAFLSNSFYPSLHLGGWRHVYLNSICNNGRPSDLKHILKKACVGFQDHRELQLEEMVDEIMAGVFRNMATYEIFYPDQLPSGCTPSKTHELLEKALSHPINNSTIRTILHTKFCELWTEKNLTLMLRRASWSLKRGTSQLSLTRCIQSIMKDAMSNFCIYYMLKLNEGKNLDIILSKPPGETPTTVLFHNVLSQISNLPLAELMLHQVNAKDAFKSMTFPAGSEVQFPFFLMISTILDQVVESTLMNCVNESDSILSMNLVDTFNEAMSLLKKNATNEKHSDIALMTVEEVLKEKPSTDEKSLFEKYLSQFITWKLCVLIDSLAAHWFVEKLNKVSNETNMQRNLLWIHITAKKNEMSLIRLSTIHHDNILQRLQFSCTVEDSDLPFEGVEMVKSLCSWFGTSIVNLAGEGNAEVWLENFALFFARLSYFIDQVLVCEQTSSLLRLSVFFFTLLKNSNDHATLTNCINEFFDRTSLRPNFETSISCFVELIKSSNEENNHMHNWMKDLLTSMFSSQMLSNVDLHWESDLRYVVTDLPLLGLENTTDLTLHLIRNSCIFGATRESDKPQNGSIRDRKAFLASKRLSFVNSLLKCDGLSIFSEEGQRLEVPRFIPTFAQGAHGSNTNFMPSGLVQTPEIQIFFKDYTDKFPSRSISEAVFQIVLENTIDDLVGRSSEQILSIFLKCIEMECKINRKEQTRLRRVQYIREDINCVGSPLGILIAESYLTCFIFKVSQELATGEPTSALDGIYSELGWSVLNCTMSSNHTRWQEIFMKNIMRIGGQSKVFDLLRRGGRLFGLNWTKELSGGLPDSRGEVEEALNLAENRLQDRIKEEERMAREMRLCPHCGQQFQIHQQNCGRFICGRADMHETPTNGVNGCGREFRESEAPYYKVDQTALEPLWNAVDKAREDAQAYNEMTRKWDLIRNSQLPYLSSKLDGGVDVIYPVPTVVNSIVNESEVIRHLIYSRSKIESFLMLPDLIELYIWLHSTFKYIISAQEASSLMLGDIMVEKILLQRFDKTHSDNILHLYERVKRGIKSHLQTCNNAVDWECETISVPVQNLDESPLIMVLSAYEDPTDGYDFLFIIINQIIFQFNEFMYKLYDLQGLEKIPPRSLLYRSPTALALRALEFVSSYDFPLTVESHRTSYTNEYDIKSLEESILEKLSTCKFALDNPLHHLRTKFQFRSDILQSSNNEPLVGIQCSTGALFAHQHDVQLFENCAKQIDYFGSQVLELCSPLESAFISKFHSFEYEQLRSMLEGIRNLLQIKRSFVTDNWTFRDLLSTSANCHIDLERFGFPNLTKPQLDLILPLQVCQIWELVKFVGYQLASESYNFSTLPLCMKSIIPYNVKETLRKRLSSLADEVGYGRTFKLLQDFKNDVLSFYQNVIKDQCNLSNNDNLKSFLEERNFCDDSDHIFSKLPDEITIQNFVSLCQELHQLTLFYVSRDEYLDFEEESDVDPCYSNPKRGRCWLFEINQVDHSGDGTSSKEERTNNDNFNETTTGLWFDVAQTAPTADDDDKHSALLPLQRNIKRL